MTGVIDSEGGFMKIKYKTVDINTPQGLRKAEWLKNHGWIIGSVGFSTILFFYRRKHGKV